MIEPVLPLLPSDLGKSEYSAYKMWGKTEPHIIYIGSTQMPILARCSAHISNARSFPDTEKAKWIARHHKHLFWRRRNHARGLCIQKLATPPTRERAYELERIAIIMYREAGFTLINSK